MSKIRVMWNNAVQHLSFSPDLARPDSRSTLGLDVDSSLHSLVLRILAIIHVHLPVPWIEDYYSRQDQPQQTSSQTVKLNSTRILLEVPRYATATRSLLYLAS